MRADVAIIGCGFSGAMVAANLVRKTTTPLSITIFEPAREMGTGVAYGTPSPHHLLNVRAIKMGAFPEDEKEFFGWLQQKEAKELAKKYNLPDAWGEDDFIPRLLYGAYIKHIWRETLALAESKKIRIAIHHEKVISITAQEDSFSLIAENEKTEAKQIVLATGNQFSKPGAASENIIYEVFHYDFKALVDREKNNSLPALIIGTGLTAVDTVLSLRAAGWKNKIILLSRRALLPAVHEKYQPYDKEPLSQQSLLRFMQEMRSSANIWQKEGNSWQAVVDSIRPRTQALWKTFTLDEKKKFFLKLFTYWNIHRHRMAPEIGNPLWEAIHNGEVELKHGAIRGLVQKENSVRAETFQRGKTEYLDAAIAFHCIGPDYRAIAKAPLLADLISHQIIHPSQTGYGLEINEALQAFADEKKSIYAMGNYLLGERLEATAVPELRAQAETIAASIADAYINL